MAYDKEQLMRDLEKAEGFVPHAYQCPEGFWTIGVGRLIDKRKGGGITYGEAMFLLENDIQRREQELRQRLPIFVRLDPVRQRALMEMAFQLGTGGLLKFQRMLGAIGRSDWASAAAEALQSTWAQQTPARAHRLANMIASGRDE